MLRYLLLLGLKTVGQDRVLGQATATRSRSAVVHAPDPGPVTVAREDPDHVTEMEREVGRRRGRRSGNRKRRKRR